MVSVRRGGRGGLGMAPRGTAFTTSPAGRPGGPLRVVVAGTRLAHQRPEGAIVTVPRGGARASQLCAGVTASKRDPALLPVPGHRSLNVRFCGVVARGFSSAFRSSACHVGPSQDV